MTTRRGRTRDVDREEYDDMSRQIFGEYQREGVSMRVLAERHGMSVTTIHRRMQDARWFMKMEAR